MQGQHTDKTQTNNPRATASNSHGGKGITMPAVPVLQNKAEPEAPLQLQAESDQPAPGTVPVAANNTGLPDNLKNGVEALSGHSLNDVKVHYNSAKPAQLQALAYAQGTDIHISPGQEKHVPHEAWHVVQQKQGRVQPTIQMKEGVPVNDDPGLEHEADVMGAKAIQTKPQTPFVLKQSSSAQASQPVQRLIADSLDNLHVPKAWLDTQLDDRAETLRTIVTDGKKNTEKQELIANIKSITDVDVTTFKQIDPILDTTKDLEIEISPKLAGAAFNALDTVKKAEIGVDAFKALTPKPKKAAFDALKIVFANVLDDKYAIYKIPASVTPTTVAGSFAKKILIDPKGLVKATADLSADFEIAKVCSLIAIYVGEKDSLGKLKTTIGLTKGSPTAEDYYEKMHSYYFTTNGIQYDEPSTHPALYSAWKYSMIFAGNSEFRNLHSVLPVALETGKSYIFDLSKHTVFVTMKKNITPGTPMGAEETVASYFNFFSDGNNFNTGETNQKVENIYLKG